MPAPDACERRVKGELHLILERKVGSWQQCEQARQIGGKLCPQISEREQGKLGGDELLRYRGHRQA
jgi:hypothetical protein